MIPIKLLDVFDELSVVQEEADEDENTLSTQNKENRGNNDGF